MNAVHSLESLFLNARTHFSWQNKPVSENLLKRIYDLAKMGPTSANCSPLRVVFLISEKSKQKLFPCLIEGNQEKTMTAPVTAILGYDLEFFNYLPKLFPHTDAKSWFEGDEALIHTTAFRNGTLQAAYFMLAAKSLGLDYGPLSGFDNQKVDNLFFKGTSIRSNFLCNLGYGKPETLFPRSPRFSAEEVCTFL